MQKIDLNWMENKFYISLSDRTDAVFSMSATDVVKKSNMDELVRLYYPSIKTKIPAVAGTFITGWLGGICLALQYMISHYNTGLDFSLDNITIQLYPKKNNYGFSFKLNRVQEVKIPVSDRKERVKEQLSIFYKETMRPLLESLSDSAQIDVGHLWGRLPNGLYQYYDQCLDSEENELIKQQINDDFNILVSELEPEVFGRKNNPFDIEFRMIDHPKECDKLMRMKSTCCLNYQTEGGRYCYACPRMKEEERKERRAELMGSSK